MTPEDRTDRERALAVACPLDACQVAAGVWCRNVVTGQPLGHIPAHAARLRAAGVLHAPLDPRDLSHDPDRGGTCW